MLFFIQVKVFRQIRAVDMRLKTTADVVVIGGGVIGTAVAYFLTKSGISVVLVERGGIACGTSGRCDPNWHHGHRNSAERRGWCLSGRHRSGERCHPAGRKCSRGLGASHWKNTALHLFLNPPAPVIF